MISQLDEDLPVRLACEISGISPSGYYAWKKGLRSPRKLKDEGLKEKIFSIHQQSGGTYGEPRLRKKLKQEGVSCGKSRIVRLMKQMGISGIGKRRFPPKTTDSNHAMPIAPRLFQTEKPETRSCPNNWRG